MTDKEYTNDPAEIKDFIESHMKLLAKHHDKRLGELFRYPCNEKVKITPKIYQAPKFDLDYMIEMMRSRKEMGLENLNILTLPDFCDGYNDEQRSRCHNEYTVQQIINHYLRSLSKTPGSQEIYAAGVNVSASSDKKKIPWLSKEFIEKPDFQKIQKYTKFTRAHEDQN